MRASDAGRGCGSGRPSAAVAVLTACLAGCKETPVLLENPLDPSSSSYVTPLDPRTGVLVDDFDRGNLLSRNLLGYCTERFDDAQHGAVFSLNLTRAGALRNTGYSLQIDFDVQGAGEPFGGFVELLAGSDVCPAAGAPLNAVSLNVDFVSFWARASSANLALEVALKDIDDNQTTPKVLVTPPDLGTSWAKVKLPLSQLVPAQSGRRVDVQRLREVNFGFAKKAFQDNNRDTRGALFIDEIAFER